MKEFRKTEEGLFICEECELLCKSKVGLSRHIIKNHNGTKIYYDKWLKEEGDGRCKICNNETKFTGFRTYYKKCCIKECSNKYTQLRTEEENVKNFGVKNSFQRKDCKEKAKQTKKEKYSDENYNNRKKCKQTCQEKYSDENYNNTKKNKQTKKEKYGNENYRNDEKIKQTCQERYGVDNPMQNKEIFEKNQKSGYKLKYFRDTNIYYRGTFEFDLLDKHYNKYPDIINAPSIKYILNNKNRVYHPDFYIPVLNLIIEVKSLYYYKKYKNLCDAKKKATISNGFNYIMIVDKNYTNFIAVQVP